MDISVELENYKLNVRTCAFIRCKGEILVCEHKNKNYYRIRKFKIFIKTPYIVMYST